MASNHANTDASKPKTLPAEAKTTTNDGAPNASINTFQQTSEPNMEPSPETGPAHPQPTTIPIRGIPPSPKKAPTTTGRKRNRSDASMTSSMQVSAPDRDDGPSPERTPDPDQSRAGERQMDMNMKGIGGVFGP